MAVSLKILCCVEKSLIHTLASPAKKSLHVA